MSYKCPEKRREYQREYQREYRERNREKRREYQREYSQRYYESNREKIREYYRRYYESNREKLLEQMREYGREYLGRNPQRGGTVSALKRSPLTPEELFCGLSKDQVNAEVAFDYRLRNLISEKEGIEYHIDHIVPISKGGVHRLWNIRAIPASENLSKSDRFDREWYNLTDEEIEVIEKATLEFTP